MNSILFTPTPQWLANTALTPPSKVAWLRKRPRSALRRKPSCKSGIPSFSSFLCSEWKKKAFESWRKVRCEGWPSIVSTFPSLRACMQVLHGLVYIFRNRRFAHGYLPAQIRQRSRTWPQQHWWVPRGFLASLSATKAVKKAPHSGETANLMTWAWNVLLFFYMHGLKCIMPSLLLHGAHLKTGPSFAHVSWGYRSINSSATARTFFFIYQKRAYWLRQ